MSSVHHINKSPTLDVQRKLLQIANNVALKMAQEYDWSTWHSWNVVDEGQDKGHPGLRAMDRSFWTLTGRFGSCLGASTHIYTALQAELESQVDTELQSYAKTVQLMTSAQSADAEIKYHAVVAMCFDTFAIMIDHALHPVAFKVSLGGEFSMAPYIPLFGAEGQERFKYFLENGEYKLTMDNKESTYPPIYFSEMDIEQSTGKIAVPAALEKQPVPDEEHILMPPRKYVSVRSLLDQKPQLIAAEPVDGKWLATTVRVQVDFANPMITLQIPNNDWLLKPQSKDWNTRLHNAPEGLRVVFTPAAVRIEQDLYAAKRVQPYGELPGIVLMQAVGEEFGLDYAVLNNMLWSVYRVWAPYRPGRADSIMNGEASEADAEG